MECSKAFLISALQPPATYFVLAFAGHYSSSFPALSLLLVLFLPPLLWCWNRQRRSVHETTPAYASIVGHCGSVVLTFVIKLLPLAGTGLGTLFLMMSCAFGITLTRMIISDPGRMDNYVLEQQEEVADICSSSDSSLRIDGQGRRHQNSRVYDNFLRGKYCPYCVSFIERYDHHCAAIHNCIGLKNTGSFLLLLSTSCIAEMLYLDCCYLYLKSVINLSAETYSRESSQTSFKNLLDLAWELLFKEAWVLSIAVFVGLQISWQVPFLVFQLYLIGINLTTDEWVNWEKISRFHKQMTTLSERPCESKTFFNPYDKGLISNYRAMLNKWK